MHDDRKFPGHGDLGFLHASVLGQAKASRFDRGPMSGARQKRRGGLEQVGAEQRIATLRYPTNAVHLARLVALGRQTEIGTNQI